MRTGLYLVDWYKYILDGKNYYCNSRCSESAKLVLQATDQHVGGNFDELVLPQRGVSLERLNNFMNLFPVRLHAFLRVLYVLNLFYTMQNSERVGNLAPSMNFGPATACDTTEGKVELVVPRGKVYLESAESLSNFLNKPVSEVPKKKWSSLESIHYFLRTSKKSVLMCVKNIVLNSRF